MGRVIPLRKESWVTRFWWGLWKWMRPHAARAPAPQGAEDPPPAAAKPRMAEQLLASQRKIVDELRRLNGILARANTQLAPPSDRRGRHKLRLLEPRLKPQS